MDIAKQGKCVHSIQVYYGADVSLKDYDSGLRQIEQSFYSKKLGPEP